ncbi:MAG TPA: Flp family type IVb pilin [Verrucomicrobiae bacterium]|jgi:Flp pilus assembly pilin Flp|nr:Flp family type IVb pilin [Verrucomicrobiae bacterium]
MTSGSKIYKKSPAFSPAKGQGMAEYALILGFMALALVLALQTFRGDLANVFQNFQNVVNGG